jgi:hypothetical protein
MVKIPNLLLIAGTGRNTGKTTLACAIIRKFSLILPITGLKISPHFHGNADNLKMIDGCQNFNIYRETSSNSGEDSSRMLQAGAFEVFYIETTDLHLMDAFQEFLQLINTFSPVVCESPALRKFVEPGVFIVLDGKEKGNHKENVLSLKRLADKVTNINAALNPEFLSTIKYEKNKWLIKKF